MDKVTLRKIIESVEKANIDDSLCSATAFHRNFLYSVEADLKQLEERIIKIMGRGTYVTIFEDGVKWVCKEVLGEE